MVVELKWKAKDIPNYSCDHCGKDGLPSIWTMIDKKGKKHFLITECANMMRNNPKYTKDDYKMTVTEK